MLKTVALLVFALCLATLVSSEFCYSDESSPTGFSTTTLVDFHDLPTGADVSSLTSLTFYLWVANANGNERLMVFDTSNPTGGNFALGSPNEACQIPGPGVGDGGAPNSAFANCAPLGKALIISDDGNAEDPRARPNGGDITIAVPSDCEFKSIGLLNVRTGAEDHDNGVMITLYDKNDAVLTELWAQGAGENGYQTVHFNVPKVRKLYIWSGSDFAITSLEYKCPCNGNPGCPTCPKCTCKCCPNRNK